MLYWKVYFWYNSGSYCAINWLPGLLSTLYFALLSLRTLLVDCYLKYQTEKSQDKLEWPPPPSLCLINSIKSIQVQNKGRGGGILMKLCYCMLWIFVNLFYCCLLFFFWQTWFTDSRVSLRVGQRGKLTNNYYYLRHDLAIYY